MRATGEYIRNTNVNVPVALCCSGQNQRGKASPRFVSDGGGSQRRGQQSGSRRESDTRDRRDMVRKSVSEVCCIWVTTI